MLKCKIKYIIVFQQKLVFQKLRAFVILNPIENFNINESSIIKKTLLDIDDDWNILLLEKFSVELLSNADTSYLLNAADFIVKDFVKNENRNILGWYTVRNNR